MNQIRSPEWLRLSAIQADVSDHQLGAPIRMVLFADVLVLVHRKWHVALSTDSSWLTKKVVGKPRACQAQTNSGNKTSDHDPEIRESTNPCQSTNSVTCENHVSLPVSSHCDAGWWPAHMKLTHRTCSTIHPPNGTPYKSRNHSSSDIGGSHPSQ